jgi:hypothetical protein
MPQHQRLLRLRPEAIKIETMKNYDRDLLVLYKADVFNEDLLQREVESLHQILLNVERSDIFCLAHELVTRNKITQKAKTILRATRHIRLKPFQFLINKN